MTTGVAGAERNPPGIEALTGARFSITDGKLYAPLITLSAKDDNKLLEQLKTGFKGTTKWNNYKSEINNQTKTSNSNYLIGPSFSKVNRLFVLSPLNENH